MAAKLRLVQWSPQHNAEFACASNDLRLYEIRPDGDIRVIKINYDLQQMKCIAWCSDPSTPRLVSVGLNSGKVALVNFTGEGSVVKEFVPEYPRTCTAIAWGAHPTDKHLISVGYNKLRAEHGTFVWDVNGPLMAVKKSRGSQVQVSTPLQSLGHSEATSSLAWSPHSREVLVMGTGFKWMRIFDLRDANNPIPVVAHQKTVCGTCFNPCNPHQLATYSDDGTIKVWDTRMLAKRTSQECSLWFVTGSRVSQIGWCPSRPGVLASISENSATLQLWDTNVAEQEAKVYGVDKPLTIKPTHEYFNPQGEHILSFDWHDTNENRILMATNPDGFLDVTVRQPMAISWSPRGSIAFTRDRLIFAGSPRCSHDARDLYLYTDPDT